MGFWDKLGSAFLPSSVGRGAQKLGTAAQSYVKNPNVQAAVASSVPKPPEYQNISANGNLLGGYKTASQQSEMYGRGSAASALKDRAMSTGDSPWLQLQMQKQGIEEDALRGRAAQESMGAGAAAQSALAMRGGMGSGSRERIARDMGRNLNMARQGVAQQGMLGRVGLRTQDDASKLSALTGLTGEEGILGRFNAQQRQQNEQFNMGTKLSDVQGRNAFNENRYGQQMGAWGAGRTADAMGNQTPQTIWNYLGIK